MKKKRGIIIYIIFLGLLTLFAVCGCQSLPGTDGAAWYLSIDGLPSESSDSEMILQNSTQAETASSEIVPPQTEPIGSLADETVREDTDGSSPPLDIFFLDVGQGDAIFVACGGEYMLVDGGNRQYSSKIYSFLKNEDVDRLKYLIATHPDADHIGGLLGALHYTAADQVFCSSSEHDSETFRSFTARLSELGLSVSVPTAGDQLTLGEAFVTVLSPTASGILSANTSVALRIVYGETSFLLMGDCERADEQAILSSGLTVKSDLIKIAHHGSDDATGYVFLNEVLPDYAVISVGSGNDYGHPTDAVLSRLRDEGAAVYRTDLQGDLHFSSDGAVIRLVTDEEETPGTAAGTDAAPTEETASASASETRPADYIVNTNTGKFHYPDCRWVGEMAEKNKWYFTGNRDELIRQGYEACKGCCP